MKIRLKILVGEGNVSFPASVETLVTKDISPQKLVNAIYHKLNSVFS